MERQTRILVSDGPATRVGQLVLAGEVVDDEPWTSTRAVAERVALPYDTFRRRFTVEVGEAPLAFRNNRRVQAAANLLRLT